MKGVRSLTTEERRELRNNGGTSVKDPSSDGKQASGTTSADEDHRFANLLSRNEDDLLKFVAQVNKVFQEKLKKPAPFMTFVFCGMQSAGKSTIMERFLNAVINIVQEGTGTRCPLDTTCIHDENCEEPLCDLSGEELKCGGEGLTVSKVFELITAHNMMLGADDKFGKAIHLVYRANNVQNMRFVDTPGIISNKSTGKDNREDIKQILISELNKPNTKLCVLLEPKEFATNPIVDFLDESLGGRTNWSTKATYLMTKFDKQLEDSRSSSKANNFFKEFHENECFPYLVITPTLPKEDLPPEELYKERQSLLACADSKEAARFKEWQDGHARFHAEQSGGDIPLDPRIAQMIGFTTAKKKMREIMLADTAKRLPEVIASLRLELDRCRKELSVLRDKQRFTDPQELKYIVQNMLYVLEQRLLAYMDGDLESTRKFTDQLQTLGDEIQSEEDSDWEAREMNFHTDKENSWRDRIARLKGEYPEGLDAGCHFLGGKQVQRAIEFFQVVMLDSLPEPFALKDMVANATGYLGGGLLRENWEHATVQITSVLMKDMSHPGVNYLVKHIGVIFRRLFQLALDDIKAGGEFSSTFRLVPAQVEKYLSFEFDKMLWDLMVNAAEKIHSALEPMYSTIDPSLPTFHGSKIGDEDETAKQKYTLNATTNAYEAVRSQKQQTEESFKDWAMKRFNALGSGSGEQAKAFLKDQNRKRSQSKRSFLPDERTSMITAKETEMILKKSFEYIVALMEFNLVNFRFQVNHYLYLGFKTELSKSFIRRASDANWKELIQADPSVASRILLLEDQIESVTESLQAVQRMQQRI
jgi:hypothetical protein